MDGATHEPNIRCDRCGEGTLTRHDIVTAFWYEERLMVVQDIPGMICTTCGEEYVSDETAVRLDQLKANRREAEPVRQMIVPVYAFDTLKPRAK